MYSTEEIPQQSIVEKDFKIKMEFFFVYTLVGKLFIYIADIYCFGTGLPISRSKHVFQYRHFKYNCKLTLLILEIKQKSEDIVHFYLTFLKFSMRF